MRPLLSLLAATLACSAITACGGSTKQQSRVARSVSERHPLVRDRDNDGDHNDDDSHVLNYGQAADPDTRLDVTRLLRSYYRAAASEDGHTACALLMPIIAESVAETDGHSTATLGKTCRVVMSKLFKLHHKTLVSKNATLKSIRVRVEGNKALTILSFAALPEVRQLTVHRVDGRWRVLDLLDGIIE